MSVKYNEVVKIDKNEALNCSSNCSFKFNYNENVSFKGKINPGNVSEGEESSIYLKPTSSNNDKVVFNGIELGTPLIISIVRKSHHVYRKDGMIKQADAELCIFHRTTNGIFYIICIPINNDSQSSSVNSLTLKSNRFFNQIIPYLSKNTVDFRDINTNNISINDVVPRGEFFYYNLNDTSKKFNIIVYHMDNGITMDQSSFDTLRRLLPNSKIYNDDSLRILSDKHDNIKDTNIILYRNGSIVENFSGRNNNIEGMTSRRGAVGPEDSDIYTYSNCSYKGTVENNNTIIKPTGEQLESIRWWAIIMFIGLIALLTAILIYFSLSNYNSSSYGSVADGTGSGISIT